MQHRSRYGRFGNVKRRRLCFELLERRRLYVSDLGCDPEWGVAASSTAHYSTNLFIGPKLDLEQQRHLDLPDGTILDTRGFAYAKLPPNDRGFSDETQSTAGGLPTRQGPEVPIFHSKPGASKKIYLDFDGQLVSGTFWNNQNYTGSYNTGQFINAPAFSIDPDPTKFSLQEQTVIREVWARMAEDFAPFQVDVTTEYPGDAAIYQGNEAIRVLISTDVDATTNVQWFPPAGGVAYLNSWSFTNGTPVWVFFNRLGTSNAKNIAEAGSHEVGHAFGLQHDGRTNPNEGYYRGHGSGQTGWAPIMGVGYDKALVQWSRGEYANANQRQDDLAIISGFVPYEADDHGDTRALATPLSIGDTGGVAASGLIATRSDRDAFQFFTQTGTVTFRVDPFELSTGKANLDAELTMFDSSGILVASSNPASTLDALVSVNLPKGTYTVIVDGVGKAATPEEQGYSDYASLGWYTLSGTVIRNRAPVINVGSTSVIANEGDILRNQGTWADPNPDDSVTLSASIGTIEKASDGTWRWSLPTQDQLPETEVIISANDDLGLTTVATFIASAVNQAPVLTASEAILSGPVLSLFTNAGTWNDVSDDTVSLNASHGSIEKRSDGTWAWEFRPSEILDDLVVTINGTDEDGGTSQIQFTVDAFVAVVNGKVFHKGSIFAGTSVQAALDTAKVLAKSGVATQKLNVDNLINTTRGINGLVFDVAGLATTGLTASDFVFRMSPTGNFNEAANPPSSWQAAPNPSAIDVTPGSSTTAARVRLEWSDNQIANRWLQVKVLANANTGLTTPQVYYIGHLLGETNGLETNFAFLVQNSDLALVRDEIGSTASVSSTVDLDKNGLHQNADIVAMRSRIGIGALRIITIPASGSSGEGEGGRLATLPVAAPGVERPKIGDVGQRIQGLDSKPMLSPDGINARMTDRVFTVLLPSTSDVFVKESLPWLELHQPKQEDELSLSLDLYFARIGNDTER